MISIDFQSYIVFQGRCNRAGKALCREAGPELEKIDMLSGHFLIADWGRNEWVQTLGDKRLSGFEDGLQYYATKMRVAVVL